MADPDFLCPRIGAFGFADTYEEVLFPQIPLAVFRFAEDHVAGRVCAAGFDKELRIVFVRVGVRIRLNGYRVRFGGRIVVLRSRAFEVGSRNVVGVGKTFFDELFVVRADLSRSAQELEHGERKLFVFRIEAEREHGKSRGVELGSESRLRKSLELFKRFRQSGEYDVNALARACNAFYRFGGFVCKIIKKSQ